MRASRRSSKPLERGALGVTREICGRLLVMPARLLEQLPRLKLYPAALVALSSCLRCSPCNGRSVELKPGEDLVEGPAIGPTNGRGWHALVRKARDWFRRDMLEASLSDRAFDHFKPIDAFGPEQTTSLPPRCTSATTGCVSVCFEGLSSSMRARVLPR